MAKRSAAMQVRAYATHGSHEFDTVSHVIRVEDVSYFCQRSYNVPDRSGLLRAVHNAGVVRSRGKLLAQEVCVVGEKHASLRQGKLELHLVGCSDEVRVRRRGDINAPQPKPVGDGMVHVLVKMKPYHRRSSCL